MGPPVPRVPGDMLPGGPEGPRREVGSGTDKFNDDLRFTTGEDDLVCRGGRALSTVTRLHQGYLHIQLGIVSGECRSLYTCTGCPRKKTSISEIFVTHKTQLFS